MPAYRGFASTHARAHARTIPRSYDRGDLFTCIVLYVYKLCNENPPTAATVDAVSMLEVKTLTHCARVRSFVSTTTVAPRLMNIERTSAILCQHRNGSCSTRQLSVCVCVWLHWRSRHCIFSTHNIHMSVYDQFNYCNFIRNQSNAMLLMYVVSVLFYRTTNAINIHSCSSPDK